MPSKPQTFNAPWKATPLPRRTEEGKERSKMYNYKWSKQRKYFLQANPICIMCEHQGVFKTATVVDHIIPHNGNEQLFWDANNWQPLCKFHHDSDKQKAERRAGKSKGDGWVKT
jgi:5-methylcytosine-specific restriction enzyme A